MAADGIPEGERAGRCGRGWWGLVPIVLVGLLLRGWQLQESLWLDELHTAWVVSGSLAEVPERAAIGNHSPLYFSLVWLVTSALGLHEVSLRLLSLVAGLALIVAAYLLTRSWTGCVPAGWCAALLVAWDANFIFYAQEARPYALLQLLAAGQVYILWRLNSGASLSWRAAWILSTAALLWLHYTAALLVLAEAVWFVSMTVVSSVWQRDRSVAADQPLGDRGVALTEASSPAATSQPQHDRSYRLWQFLFDMLCVSVLLLPAAPQLLDIAGRRGNWAMFVGEPSWTAMVGWFSLGQYLVIPLLGLGAATLAGRLAGRRRPAGASAVTVSLIVCWLMLPLLLAWLATTADLARVFFPRYLVASALAPVILAGICIAACHCGTPRVLVAAAVLGVSLHGSGILQRFAGDGRFLHDRNQDWRAAVRRINSFDAASGSAVLVRSGFLEADRLRQDSGGLLRQFCLAPVNSLYRIQPADRPLVPLPTTRPGRLDDPLVDTIRRHSAAWFVINGSPRAHLQFERELSASLRRHQLAAHPQFRQTFGQLLVVLYRIEEGSAAGSRR